MTNHMRGHLLAEFQQTVTARRIRAECIWAPVAVGRLVACAKFQAVDSSCTPRKCLLSCTGLTRIGYQLLELPSVGCELQLLESRRVCTGVVIHIPWGGRARAIGGAVQIDNIGLRAREDASPSDEQGEKGLHSGWERLRKVKDDWG